MTSNSTTPCLPQSEIETAGHLFDNWFDPIEAGLRDRAREFLQAMLEGELDMVLARSRYGRRANRPSGDAEDAAGCQHRARRHADWRLQCRRQERLVVARQQRQHGDLVPERSAGVVNCVSWEHSDELDDPGGRPPSGSALRGRRPAYNPIVLLFVLRAHRGVTLKHLRTRSLLIATVRKSVRRHALLTVCPSGPRG